MAAAVSWKKKKPVKTMYISELLTCIFINANKRFRPTKQLSFIFHLNANIRSWGHGMDFFKQKINK